MKSSIVITILLFTNFVWSGGDSIDNGASLSENRIVLAFNNIKTYIEATIKDTSNKLDVNQVNLLSKILHSLPEEKKLNPTMIQFSDDYARFYIDGQMKVALTGLKLGDPILINRKYIQYLNEKNKQNDFSTFQALSILVHELGHHQGETDHSFLDYLGAAVANKSRFEEMWYVLNPRDQNLGAQLFAPVESLKVSASLNIVNWNTNFDITTTVLNMELCKLYNLGSEQRSLHFWNIYWQNPMSSAPVLRGLLSFDCRWPNGEWMTRIGDEVYVKLEKVYFGNIPAFAPNKMSLNVVRCEDDGEGCQKNKNSVYEQKLKKLSLSNEEDIYEK